MIPIPLLFLSLLSNFCFAASSAQSRTILESLKEVPSGFVRHDAAAADSVLNLRISLKQGNIAGLEQELYAVSTPGSEKYGKHLSKTQVEEFVKPSTETLSLVNEWLSLNGVSSEPASPAGDYLQVSVPVSKANMLLDADFSVFVDQETNRERIRTLSYSIPANLQEHINFIHPTVSFTRLPSRAATKTVERRKKPSKPTPTSTPCATEIAPSCLQTLYSIPTTLATQTGKNTMTVSGFDEQTPQMEFLSVFLEMFRPDLSPNTTYAIQLIDGGQDIQNVFDQSDEGNLDIQYSVGIASGVPVTFLSVGEFETTDGISGFLDEANFILSEEILPTVLTTSYGFDEAAVTASIAIQLCNAYMQLGARGTSLFFSSGDGGVGGSQSGEFCDTQFIPTFPSSCPFVTSVGGTSGIPETAAFFSGGGFSNLFASPSYQTDAVSSYLELLGTTNAGFFNLTGRAFPDLSAQSINFQIIFGRTVTIGTKIEFESGTSCSTPTVASIVALLNDRLIAAGKSPLGFLNPLIYSKDAAAAFNDITTGSNPGCSTNGFPATAGWDPVTGVGTPDFARFLSAVGL